jgi:hypothetical protein
VKRRAIVAGAVLGLCVAVPTAAADDDAPIHLTAGATCRTPAGVDLDLPPGYYLSEPKWDALDLEVRRLQDTETRLSAENLSLRASANAWRPGWRSIATALAVGLGAGVYLAR